jgi:hypothetical protein
MMTVEVGTALALMAGLWSVLCRLNQMHLSRTDPLVAYQHIALGIGLAAALFLQPPLAKLALAGSVAVYLLAGSHRWRFAAPAGTETRVGELCED